MTNYDLVCPGCGSENIIDFLNLTDEPGSPYDGFQHFLTCQRCKLDFEEKECEMVEAEPEGFFNQRLESFEWSCQHES